MDKTAAFVRPNALLASNLSQAQLRQELIALVHSVDVGLPPSDTPKTTISYNDRISRSVDPDLPGKGGGGAVEQLVTRRAIQAWQVAEDKKERWPQLTLTGVRRVFCRLLSSGLAAVTAVAVPSGSLAQEGRPAVKLVDESAGRSAVVTLTRPTWSGDRRQPDWIRAAYSVVETERTPPRIRIVVISPDGDEATRSRVNRTKAALLALSGKRPSQKMTCSSALVAGCLIYFNWISRAELSLDLPQYVHRGEYPHLTPIGTGYDRDGSRWLVCQQRAGVDRRLSKDDLFDCLRFFAEFFDKGGD